jgi:hypothetical protein
MDVCCGIFLVRRGENVSREPALQVRMVPDSRCQHLQAHHFKLLRYDFTS